ncbi:hypothetical protein ILP97_35205 [Amycolatopsis sp. H6(2020)]|nr:hypothetical protein [Amycolatopsis sp. H6(2020)]
MNPIVLVGIILTGISTLITALAALINAWAARNSALAARQAAAGGNRNQAQTEKFESTLWVPSSYTPEQKRSRWRRR